MTKADPKQVCYGIEPIESGALAFSMAVIAHLLLPFSSRIRINDSGWPWLDPYRIGQPGIGWLAYVAAALAVAFGVALLVTTCHWLAQRPVADHPRARLAMKLAFLVGGAFTGFLIPPFLHYFPRMQVPAVESGAAPDWARRVA